MKRPELQKPDGAMGPAGQSAKAGAALQMEQIQALEKKIVELKMDLLASAASTSVGRLTDDLTFLLMRVGKKMIAIPVNQVDEVAQMPAVLPMRDLKTAVLGLVDFHGRMLAVVDLHQLLGMGASELDIDKCLVVFSCLPHAFAAMIDEPADVVTVKRRAIQISDEILPGAIQASGVLRMSTGETILICDAGAIALQVGIAGMIALIDENMPQCP